MRFTLILVALISVVYGNGTFKICKKAADCGTFKDKKHHHLEMECAYFDDNAKFSGYVCAPKSECNKMVKVVTHVGTQKGKFNCDYSGANFAWVWILLLLIIAGVAGYFIWRKWFRKDAAKDSYDTTAYLKE